MDFFVSGLVTPIQQSWASTVNFFQDAWAQAQGFFTDSFAFVSDAFQNLVINPLVNTWNGAIDVMKSAFRGFADFVGGILSRVFQGIQSVLKNLNVIRKAEGGKPLTLASTGTPVILESLTDYSNAKTKKATAAAEKELAKQQKAAAKEQRDVFREQQRIESQALNSFNQAQSILDMLSSGRKLTVGQLKSMGDFLGQIQVDSGPMRRGMEMTQASAQRAANLVGPGMITPAAQQFLQAPGPTPTSAGTITSNGVTINIETGPVLRQGNQQFVSLDAFNEAVRQAALAGSRNR